MADDEENVSDIDFSQIRTSIQLGGRMIEHILNGIHYGSPEVRCLLLDECDIILECRVCRGLFRALPNFVAHKRIYCKQAYIVTQEGVFNDTPEDDVVVVEPCAPEDDETEVPAPDLRSPDEKVKDTINQINEGMAGKSEMYKLYSQAAEKIERQKTEKKTINVVLAKIASNPNAVRVLYGESDENLEEGNTEMSDAGTDPQETDASKDKTQVKPIATINPKSNLERVISSISQSKSSHQGHSSLEQVISNISASKSASQGRPKGSESPVPKAKAKQSNEQAKPEASKVKAGILNKRKLRMKTDEKQEMKEDAPSNSVVDLDALKCLECNVKYSSRKTLLYHVQIRHSRLRTFYPCPYCQNVFFYFWGLTRHLKVRHKKSLNQINKMRKSLRGAAFTKSVTKQCSQAKDQLAYTTELISEEDNESENDHGDLPDKSSPQTASVKPQQQSKETTPKQGESIVEISQKTHDTRQRYQHQLVCDKCDKVFWKKGRLTNHKKYCTASGKTSTLNPVRSHICPMCTNAFIRKSHLTRHMKICGKKTSPVKDKREDTEVNKSRERTSTADEKADQFSCSHCKRTFEKKKSLDNHKRACPREPVDGSETGKKGAQPSTPKESGESLPAAGTDGKEESSSSETLNAAGDGNAVDTSTRSALRKRSSSRSEDGSVRVVEEIWIRKQPGRPTEKVKSNRIYVLPVHNAGRLQCQDTKKLCAIVDETDLKCEKCGQEFTSISNLRRHAIRHLGWKRFKCKLCKFSSYNKSECNTHIVRTHSEKYRFTSAESLIVDLNKEASIIRSEKKFLTLSEREAAEKRASSQKPSGAPNPKRSRQEKTSEKESSLDEDQNIGPIDPSRKFNISTRNSPRKFDTRPYHQCDNMSTLITRKSYYPKPDLKRKSAPITKTDFNADKSLEVSSDQEKDIDTMSVDSKDSRTSGRESRSSTRRAASVEKDDKDTGKRSSSAESSAKKVSETKSSKLSRWDSLPSLQTSEGKSDTNVKKKPKVDSSPKTQATDPKIQPKSASPVQQKRPSTESKSPDFLAPWPRAPEPMSVQEMFALIRQPPGSTGSGRRKSTGDASVKQPVKPVDSSPRTSPKTAVKSASKISPKADSDSKTSETSEKSDITLTRAATGSGHTKKELMGNEDKNVTPTETRRSIESGQNQKDQGDKSVGSDSKAETTTKVALGTGSRFSPRNVPKDVQNSSNEQKTVHPGGVSSSSTGSRFSTRSLPQGPESVETNVQALSKASVATTPRHSPRSLPTEKSSESDQGKERVSPRSSRQEKTQESEIKSEHSTRSHSLEGSKVSPKQKELSKLSEGDKKTPRAISKQTTVGSARFSFSPRVVDEVKAVESEKKPGFIGIHYNKPEPKHSDDAEDSEGEQKQGQARIRQSVSSGCRFSPRQVDQDKLNLSATIARRGTQASNSLSLNLRTSRPGVDWSKNSQEQNVDGGASGDGPQEKGTKASKH